MKTQKYLKFIKLYDVNCVQTKHILNFQSWQTESVVIMNLIVIIQNNLKNTLYLYKMYCIGTTTCTYENIILD